MWMGTWTRWTHFIRTRAGKKAGDFKDSHIGAFAAIMLALYYMIDIAAISEIHTQKAVSALAAVFFWRDALVGLQL